MKYIRYSVNSAEKYGILVDNTIKEIDGNIFGEFKENGKSFSLNEVTLLPPVKPTKIVAIGLNYRAHAVELNMITPNEPLIFLKPVSAIIASGENIEYPDCSSQVDYEGELGVVIKKTTKDIERDEAKDYILGYTCINDITARDLQRQDVQFTRAKSFDTFCPIGPCIETEVDPLDVEIKTYLNGKLMQDSNTSDMIFDVYYIVSYLSKIMTLEEGDVIITGTPQGVAHMHKGDEVVVEIENIGRLENKVI